MYERERPLPQKLVKGFTTASPKFGSENQSPAKRPTTLYDLIQEFVPNKKGKGNKKKFSLKKLIFLVFYIFHMQILCKGTIY
jgi:hypothetical protein